MSYIQSRDGISTPLSDITYYVTGVSLLGGCPQIDSFSIKVIDTDVFIPNAFTPNGDGINDIFKVVNRGKLNNVQEFKVFNRWGQELFSTNDINYGWDGSYRGEKQDTGTYFFTVTVSYPNGKTRFFKGDLTLIR